MASASRRYRRANGMKTTEVRKALESRKPLNALYALIPDNRRKSLDRFMRCFGLNPADLRAALVKERT